MVCLLGYQLFPYFKTYAVPCGYSLFPKRGVPTSIAQCRFLGAKYMYATRRTANFLVQLIFFPALLRII